MALLGRLISAIESGKSTMTLPDLIHFAEQVAADLNWLLKGKSSVAGGVSRARKLDRSGLLSLSAGGGSLRGKGEFVSTYGRYSDRAVALSIFDRSMAPSFDVGDLVVVDPDVPAEFGDCVAVVLLTSKAVLFRRVRKSDGGTPQSPPFVLTADSADFEPIPIADADRPWYVGTLVERVRFGPR